MKLTFVIHGGGFRVPAGFEDRYEAILAKALKGDGFDQTSLFYAALWLVLISGNYMSGWLKWKKENPEEYERERAQGKGGLI